jgi:hypothetical protein
LGLNTLLYSKLKTFNNVYINEKDDKKPPEHPEYICFEMDNKISSDDFLMSLAYVPILSCMQLRSSESIKDNVNHKEYISLRKKIDLKELQKSSGKFWDKERRKDKEFWNPDYDLYDFTVIENKTGDKFYSTPRGYGQYFVRKNSAKTDTSREKYLYYACDFIKNDEWCNFGSSVKRAGGETFNHNDYRTSDEVIRITGTNEYEIAERLLNLNSSQILYNVYLSANMLNALSDDEKNLTDKGVKKRRMQISHYLYGIYFGPDLSNTNIPVHQDIREFFASFADRSRIENMVKYYYQNTNDLSFDSMIQRYKNDKDASPSFLQELQVQRLYYPFYLGVNDLSDKTKSDSKSIADYSVTGKYYTELEEADKFFMAYKDELYGDTLEKHYLGFGTSEGTERYNFYTKYVGGTEMPKEVEDNINEKYSRVKYRIAGNNAISLTIFYTDQVGQAIANHYKALISDYFAKNGVTANIEPEDLGSSNWQNTARNYARRGIYTLFVKGWNYKFDMLDELDDQFVDKESLNAVQYYYNQLVDGSEQKAENVIQRIAKQYVDHTIMIPLVGIQNYAVYINDKNGNNGVAASMEQFQKVELLLLPYYWRKK